MSGGARDEEGVSSDAEEQIGGDGIPAGGVTGITCRVLTGATHTLNDASATHSVQVVVPGH